MSAKTVTGHINAAELIGNGDRRFGSNLHYAPAMLVQAGKEPRGLLLTKHQIQEAGERWDANPEDQLPFEPEQVRVDRAVAIARKDERAKVVASMLEDCNYVRRRALFLGYLGGASLALAVVTLGRLL
jgi:hypothetical protein